MHWVNGKRAAQVSIEDRGLLYGDGLFETMLWDIRGIQLLKYHLERLQFGCELLHIKYPGNVLKLQLQKVVSSIAADGLTNAVIRLTVTRGVGLRGYAAYETNDPTIIISATLSTPPELGQTARLFLCKNRIGIGSPIAGLKHLNRLEQVLLANELKDSDYDEGLVLDYEGTVISGTRSNVFLINDSVLQTPALDRCGIAGTIRRLVIERLAPQLNMEVRIGRLSLVDVERATEIFYCNSLIGVMSVSFFMGKTYEKFTTSEAIATALKNTICEFS